MTSLFFAAALAWAEDVSAAAPAAGQRADIMPTILIFGGMFAFMYLVIFRPQQKKQREQQAMLSSIQKGDRIQTSGGILGLVTGGDQSELTVEIAPQVRVKISRGYVARVIKPGQPAEKDKDKK